MKRSTHLIYLSLLSLLAILVIYGYAHPGGEYSFFTTEDKCIQPKVTFKFYTLGPGGQVSTEKNVYPLPPWKPVLSLPVNYAGYSLFFARGTGNSVEIWMRGDKKLIYHVKERKLEEITNSFGWPYIASSGKMFAFGHEFISVYDEISQKFKPLIFPEALPPDTGKEYFERYFDQKHEIFWFFQEKGTPYDGISPGYTIYSADPNSLTTRKRAETEPGYMSSKAIAPDGTIYFTLLRDGKGWDQSRFDIYRFDPKTNSIDIVPRTTSDGVYLISLHSFPDVFVDSKGNLWAGAQGFRTSNGVWYQVLPSPILVSPVGEWVTDYGYYSIDDPMFVMESSDGRLWFSLIHQGMIWLDPNKGEWCWFTTYQSNIVEDLNGNLWMIANGALYQYPAKDRD